MLVQMAQLYLLLVLIMQIVMINIGNGLEFNYVNFSDSSNITLEQRSNLSESIAWLLPDPDPRWATDPNNNSATHWWDGWMVYNNAIPFLGPNASNKAHSFNTSFTFKFITGAEVDSSPSGMAFFITSISSPPLHPINKYFGLSNSSFPTTYFAVEFDTFNSSVSNTSDPSGSHVGIDINSIDSAVAVDTSNSSANPYYPQLYLYNNYTFRVWITYDDASQITRVWMTNASSDYSHYLNPPDTLPPIMEYGQDLSPIFAENDGLMYVGFSAATISNSKMLGVAIYSWYFSISDDGIKPSSPPPPSLPVPVHAPAPAPSTSPPSPSTLTSSPPPPPPPPASANAPPPRPPPPPSPNTAPKCLLPKQSFIRILVSLALIALFFYW